MKTEIQDKIRRMREKNQYRLKLIHDIRTNLQHKKEQHAIESAEMVFNKTPKYVGQKI